VAPLELNVQPPLNVNLYAAFVSTGFLALNFTLADTPPNNGYIAVILSHNPLLTKDVNNVLVAADTVESIPLPPAFTTAVKYVLASVVPDAGGVELGVGVTVFVGVTDGVIVDVGVTDGVTVDVGVTEGVGVIVDVGVTEGVGVTVDVGVTLGVGVTVDVGVTLGVGVLVGVTLGVGVGLTGTPPEGWGTFITAPHTFVHFLSLPNGSRMFPILG
jgi:hypothetical protein